MSDNAFVNNHTEATGLSYWKKAAQDIGRLCLLNIDSAIASYLGKADINCCAEAGGGT